MTPGLPLGRHRHRTQTVVMTVLALLVSMLPLAPLPAIAAEDASIRAWGSDEYSQGRVPPAAAVPATAVAAGGGFSLALRTDGTVVAWGYNGGGETLVPVGLQDVTAIAAGAVFGVALKSDGTVTQWGRDGYGQSTVPDGLDGVVAVSAGSSHTLALRADGTVAAWGQNEYGQTDVPTTLTDVTAVASGASAGHSLALKADGTVVAWGRNDYGQSTVPSGLTGVVAITAGYYSSIAVKGDGSIVAWGNTEYVPTTFSDVTSVASGDRLRGAALTTHGTVTTWGQVSTEIAVPSGLTDVVQIAVGYSHGLALRSNGEIVGFGWDSQGAGADVAPVGAGAIRAVAAGQDHNVALLVDGTVTAWGSASYRQTSVPASLTDVVAVAAGAQHSLALRADGTVVGWGGCEYDMESHTYLPCYGVAPTGLTDVIAVAAGGMHSLALRADGTVVAWGSTHASAAVRTVPAGLSDVVAIAAGGEHSLALKDDGTVVAWGSDSNGQPRVPTGLQNVVAVAAGGQQSLALRRDGTVAEWFKSGPTTGEPYVDGAGLTGIVAISAGLLHAAALRQDGTVVAWGSNQRNSNGPPTGQATVPAGLTDVTAISAGGYHTLAVVNGEKSWPTLASTPVVTGSTDRTAPLNWFSGPVTVTWTATDSVDGTLPAPPAITLEYDGPGQRAVSEAVCNSSSICATGLVEGINIDSAAPGASHARLATSGAVAQLTAEATDGLSGVVAGEWYADEDPGVGHGSPMSFHEGVLSASITTPPDGGSAIWVRSVDLAGNWSSPARAERIAPTTWGDGVHAWGNDTYSQGRAPSATAEPSIDVAASGDSSFALRADGHVVAWGGNSWGETSVPPDLDDVTAIAAGGAFVLALRSDGTITQWGDRRTAQYNIPPGLSDVVNISAGSGHALALRANGTVVAWGQNSCGEGTVPSGLSDVVAIDAGPLASYNLALKADGTVVAWGCSEHGQTNVPAGLSGVTSIAAGPFYSVAVKQDGSIVTWGGEDNIHESRPPAGLTGVVQVELGDNLAGVARKSDGTVVAWGDWISTFGPPAGLSDVVDVAVGVRHALALRRDGTIVTFGRDAGPGNGRLLVPNDASDLVAVDAGTNHNLGITADGRVVAWGANGNHQSEVPGGLSDVVAVSAGGQRSLALRADGTVVGWGGCDADEDISCPDDVPAGLAEVTAISAGYMQNLALKRDGTVVAWGPSWFRYASDSLKSLGAVPAGLSGVTAVAAGSDHNLALRSDGTVVAWGGSNSSHQLDVPAGLSDVVAISAGGDHSLALRRNGTVVAWGNAHYGQVAVPAGLSNVVAISAGGGHSLALTRDGTVVAWGADYSSNGVITEQGILPPELVEATSISAGGGHNLVIVGGVKDWPDIVSTPVVTGTADRAANAAGWYSGPVTVSWSATDDTDGDLTPPPPTILSTEGADQTATSADVCNSASVCAAGTLAGISIDSTGPTIDTPALSASTIVVGSSTTVTVGASDALSGVVDGEWSAGPEHGTLALSNDTLSATLQPEAVGTFEVVVRARDAAGNWSATASVPLTVSPQEDSDGVASTTEAAAPNNGDGNADGTPDNEQDYVTSLPAFGAAPSPDAVYLTLTVAEGVELVDVTTIAPQETPPPAGLSLPAGLVSFSVSGVTEGSDQWVSFHVPSTEGVTGYAKYDDGVWSMLPADRVDIDHTVNVVKVRLTDGGIGDSDGVANGVIVDPGGVAVVSDRFTGFYAPVDMGGVWNTVRGGSTVPLKFELFRDDVEMTSTSAIAGLTYRAVACAGSAPWDAIEETTTGGTALRYDAGGGQFIQSWKTPRSQGCYRVAVRSSLGTELVAYFRLT